MIILQDFKIDPDAVIVSDQGDLITAEQYWNAKIIVVSIEDHDLSNLDNMKKYQARIVWTVNNALGREDTIAGIMIPNELNITMLMLKSPDIHDFKKSFWELYALNFEQDLSEEIEWRQQELHNAKHRLEMLKLMGTVDYQDYVECNNTNNKNIQSKKLKNLLKSIRPRYIKRYTKPITKVP
jgi:hypothetical protein